MTYRQDGIVYVHTEPGYVGEYERTEQRIAKYNRRTKQQAKEHARDCQTCRRRRSCT